MATRDVAPLTHHKWQVFHGGRQSRQRQVHSRGHEGCHSFSTAVIEHAGSEKGPAGLDRVDRAFAAAPCRKVRSVQRQHWRSAVLTSLYLVCFVWTGFGFPHQWKTRGLSVSEVLSVSGLLARSIDDCIAKPHRFMSRRSLRPCPP